MRKKRAISPPLTSTCPVSTWLCLAWRKIELLLGVRVNQRMKHLRVYEEKEGSDTVSDTNLFWKCNEITCCQMLAGGEPEVLTSSRSLWAFNPSQPCCRQPKTGVSKSTEGCFQCLPFADAIFNSAFTNILLLFYSSTQENRDKEWVVSHQILTHRHARCIIINLLRQASYIWIKM